MSRKTYIIDFFNIFSDYRETYYNKSGIDFHKVKYANLLKDTDNFFDLFFQDYIKVANIPVKSDFIFVMKRIYNYDNALVNVIKKYTNVSIKFVLVNDKYSNSLIEQNKDDYICQYLLTVYANSILISNDKYKNKCDYTWMFLELERVNIQIIQKGINASTFYIVDQNTTRMINSINFDRTSIPKRQFNTLKMQ
jgi:hypothetical protein